MSDAARIVQISVSRGGVPKTPVDAAKAKVTPGRRLRVGDDLVLEVTRYTSPCTNINAAFLGGDYARVSQKRHPGWSRVYTRVLGPGLVRRGDPVHLVTEAASLRSS